MLRQIDHVLTTDDQREFWQVITVFTVQTTHWRSMMSRFELIAYLLAAVLGSLVAGHVGGLIGVLAVFAGIGTIGFTEMLLIMHQADR